MSPKELRELLLYGPQTEETYRKLPPEAGGVWWSQPSREQIANAKRFMYLRVGLIVLGTIYLTFFHRDIGEAKVLPWVIAAYEFAYYTVRKEKSEIDYSLAREGYSARVDELIKKLHPTYKLETDT